MMDSRGLRQAAVFHAVAQSGSLAAAARRLGRTAPALHHDLKLLEQEIGAPLFLKVGRALRLAPAARDFYQSISRALDDVERSKARLARGAGKTPLRVGAVSGFGRYVLRDRLLGAASRDTPVDLLLGSHDDVVAALQSNEVEVGLTYRPTSIVHINSAPIFNERYVLIGPAGQQALSSLDRIEEMPFVTYDEYEYVFSIWFDAVLGRQPTNLRRLDHATELEEAIASVAFGRGFTISPADAVMNGPLRDRCRIHAAGAEVTNMIFALSRGADIPAIISEIFELNEPLET